MTPHRCCSMPQAKKPRKRHTPWTLADYAAFATARNGTLLTKRPRTHTPKVHDKLRFRCQYGHQWTPQANAIKNQGAWCFRCARAGDNAWTIAQYRDHATANGGKLLDRRANDHRPLVTERLRFRCAQGHTWNTVAYSIKTSGSWCHRCRRARGSWTKRQMRDFAKSNGGWLLSKHSDQPLMHLARVRLRCASGHEWECTAGQIMQYQTWCGKCHDAKRKKPPDDLHAAAQTRGGMLIQEGRNRTMPATWECSHGHRFQAAPYQVLKRGGWCPECSASRSERIVRAFFEQIFDKPFPKLRPRWLRNSSGRLLELDGYCEELALAFEHQGGQHYREIHSFGRVALRTIKTRDGVKRQLCEAHGVRLIEVPELMRATSISDVQELIVRECRKAGVVLPPDADQKHVDLAAVYSTTRDDEALLELHTIAKARGGRCEGSQYLGFSTKLLFRCASGHEWRARPSEIRQGTWCKRCASTAVNAKKKLTIELMRAIARERGGECLSEAYVDAHAKLRWRCGKCGNEWDTPAFTIRKGGWCPPCGYRKGWDHRRVKYGPDGGNRR